MKNVISLNTSKTVIKELIPFLKKIGFLTDAVISMLKTLKKIAKLYLVFVIKAIQLLLV